MPKRSKILDEGRMSVLRKYIGNEISRAEASRRCGVAPKTIDRWCIRYRTDGVTGFVPQESNRVYDVAEKEAAVKAYLSGEGSLTQICENTKFAQINSSITGFRCIMVIRNLEHGQEEAV